MAESYYQGAYTGAEIDAAIGKVGGVEAGAQVNVQSDWNEADSTADDFIKNKPPLGTAAAANTTTTIASGGTGLPTAGTVYDDQQRQDAGISVLTKYGGGKNLLKNEAVTLTHNGITFTVNQDKSIHITGSSESSSSHSLCSIGHFSARQGDVLTAGIVSDTIFIHAVSGTTSTRTHECTPIANADIGVNREYEVVVLTGSVDVDTTIYPMICTEEDYTASPEYQPSAPTNRELYEMILALQNGGNS